MANFCYTIVNITFDSKEQKDQFIRKYWYDKCDGICFQKVIPVPSDLLEALAKPQLGLAFGDTEEQKKQAEALGFHVLSENIEEYPRHRLGVLWGVPCTGFDRRILANEDTYISEAWTNKWCEPSEVLKKLSDDPLVGKFVAVSIEEVAAGYSCYISDNLIGENESHQEVREFQEAWRTLRYGLGHWPVCAPGN
jgi:hypothetical protein